MREILELAVGVAILAGVYLITQRIVIWRLRRTCKWVLRDLERKGAYDSKTAVPLPYSRKDPMRIGVRDYRPKAVEALLLHGKVAMNEEGGYYISGSDGAVPEAPFPDEHR